MITVQRGNWYSCNDFISEDGIEFKINPYDYIYKEVKDMFPFDCFIQLDGNTVISVIEDTLEDS